MSFTASTLGVLFVTYKTDLMHPEFRPTAAIPTARRNSGEAPRTSIVFHHQFGRIHPNGMPPFQRKAYMLGFDVGFFRKILGATTLCVFVEAGMLYCKYSELSALSTALLKKSQSCWVLLKVKIRWGRVKERPDYLNITIN